MTVKKSFLSYIYISSWNVYGLPEEINGSKHYKTNEDEFLQILSKFDILCLLWARHYQSLNLSRFQIETF